MDFNRDELLDSRVEVEPPRRETSVDSSIIVYKKKSRSPARRTLSPESAPQQPMEKEKSRERSPENSLDVSPYICHEKRNEMQNNPGQHEFNYYNPLTTRSVGLSPTSKSLAINNEILEVPDSTRSDYAIEMNNFMMVDDEF
jgi:hypothetical protein